MTTLAELVEKARQADARMRLCGPPHWIYADGLSQIRSNVRSYVCQDCGTRFTPEEVFADIREHGGRFIEAAPPSPRTGAGHE